MATEESKFMPSALDDGGNMIYTVLNKLLTVLSYSLPFAHLCTDGLEHTVVLISLSPSSAIEEDTYLNPSPPVATTTLGACCCQCTSFTSGI
jgi:hypothetical protein